MRVALRVVRVVGPATVQDAGRPGFRAHGVPPGGALVPGWLAAAGAALGNPDDAAGIEHLGPLTLRAEGGAVTLCAQGRRLRLADGEALDLPGPHPAAVAYVAVAGGLDLPRVLGGRGALPTGALPGLAGRVLRAGDVLPVGRATLRAPTVHAASLDPAAPLRVLPGPDLDAFADDALDRLIAGAWRIAAFDRTGHRLNGAALPRRGEDARPSAPMVRGCVQVPADGQPCVVGPDGPTLGGYPVLAVLLRADAEALAARPPGSPVRFTR